MQQQQQAHIQLEGMGTLWNVLTPEKRAQLQAELQGVIDRWHRTEMATIVNAAMFEVQRAQAAQLQAAQDNKVISEDG